MELKKAHAEEHENEERWLLTYADLITLLMVFFVVMYSMSRTDVEKFKALASGLKQVFGKPAASATGMGGQPIAGNAILPSKANGDARKGTRNNKADGDVRTRRIKALKNDLDSLMEKRGLAGSVTTKVDPKGPKLVMELADSLLFDPGSADLTPAAIELMKPIAEVLGARNYNIHVEGHTDNVPISGRYRNNFELSTARAVNVIMFLTESGGLPPQLFSASGYGEYRPIADNATSEGRAKNRRVDFVIYDENALDSMLGSSTSDDSPQDGEPLMDEAPASEPDSVSQEGAPVMGAHAPPADVDTHSTSMETAEPPAAAAPEHGEPSHAPDAALHAEPATATPSLDAHVETSVQNGSHASLTRVLALPQSNAN